MLSWWMTLANLEIGRRAEREREKIYMMTQGIAQQTGKQIGMTAAPPYAPPAPPSASAALADALLFDFLSKVRD